jgi:aminopeptidase N
LSITESEQQFEFANIAGTVVPSLLRNFSAPVRLKVALNNNELAFLMAHDNDSFNQWNAAQQLALNIILGLIENFSQNIPLQLDAVFVNAFKQVLLDKSMDKALVSRILTLPSEDYIAEVMDVVDVDAIHQVREFCKSAITRQLEQKLLETYQQNQSEEFDISPDAIGQRSLKNLCLSYLQSTGETSYQQLAMLQYTSANNMTDQLAAFRLLTHQDCDYRAEVLQQFYQQWQDDNLVIDKWFIVQATACLDDSFTSMEALLAHDAFDIRVPNRVRSLIGAFSQANPVCFHHVSGRGYQLLADSVIRLNDINPQIAARLLLPLIQWKRYDTHRQQLMQQQLKRIEQIDGLASDVYEIVNRGLQTG